MENGAGENGAGENGAGENGAGENGAGENGAGENGAGMPRPLSDDNLASVLVRGLCPTTVVLVDYDPRWPVRYAEAADRLRAVLGIRLRLIEHIGSTSVPGLIAKPVIDIVIGIDDPDDEIGYLPALETAGYEPRVREPGHRCLRGSVGELAVNLHCYPPGSVSVRRYLVFRDRLRADEADRARYAAVKRALAARGEWPDMNYYAEAKGPTIEHILARAGWTDRT
jgi:GrpB-like predicted nucleotidyltransferase (UPF0157 family)